MVFTTSMGLLVEIGERPGYICEAGLQFLACRTIICSPFDCDHCTMGIRLELGDYQITHVLVLRIAR